MNFVDVAPGLIIGIREGIEAALVIAVIVGYLNRTTRSGLRKYVYLGSAAAGVVSALVAGAIFLVSAEFAGPAEALFEGFTMVLAVVVLTSMLFWMMSAAKNIRAHVEERLDAVLRRSQVFGLAALAFLVVVREGIETALFMYGAGTLTTPLDSVVGVGVGLVIAGFVGAGIVHASWRIDLRRFFQITGVALTIIAAGLFANGVSELQEGFGWGFGSGFVYDWSAILPDDTNPAGSLLRGIVGYSQRPTVLAALAYVAYWGFAILLYLGIRNGRLPAALSRLRRTRETVATVPAKGG